MVAAASLAIVWIVQELQAQSRTKFYMQQGFRGFITPWVGGEQVLYQNGPEERNHLRPMYEMMLQNRREGKPGMVFNMPSWGCASIYLTDIALIREFFSKETEYTKRVLPGDIKTSFGFILESGQKGLDHRAIFGEFFSYSSLNKLIPVLRKIIDQEFSALPVKDGRLLMEKGSKKFVDRLIITIVTVLIFGEGAPVPTFENGLTFCDELMGLLSDIFPGVVYDSFNRLFRDFPNKWNLMPSARRAHKRSNYMAKKLADCIQERTRQYEATGKKYSFCLVDMMVEFNSKAQSDKKLAMDDMIGNCVLFLVAGYDTTSTAVTSMIYSLAERPELYERVKKETKDLDSENATREQIEECLLLDQLLKESIRVNPPSAFVFERLATRDFSLGKYNFKKGDKFQIPLGILMWDAESFPTEKGFDMSAITDANKKHYMPFSIGKRNCVGQSLVQLEMKLIAIYISQRFKLVAIDKDPKYVIGFTMQVVDCEVQFEACK